MISVSVTREKNLGIETFYVEPLSSSILVFQITDHIVTAVLLDDSDSRDSNLTSADLNVLASPGTFSDDLEPFPKFWNHLEKVPEKVIVDLMIVLARLEQFPA